MNKVYTVNTLRTMTDFGPAFSTFSIIIGSCAATEGYLKNTIAY